MRGYNIYSFFQATEMAWVVKNKREWLLTLDTGMLNVIPEYSYSDYQRAKLLAENGGEYKWSFYLCMLSLIHI